MRRIIPSASSLLALLLFAGCGDDDNPVDPDAWDDHAEAFGLVILSSGEELVRQEEGKVEGEIDVGPGLETPLLTVRFLAEDGERFVPEPMEGYGLAWEIGDESIAEVEHHDEDGAWSFHIAGLETGHTTLKIKLNHNDHADFVSKDIEIHVEEGGPGEEHDHDDEG